jgi:lipid II:glycine glycyltransferase (peptidoglycan interpeptide bridge formation enzyme)
MTTPRRRIIRPTVVLSNPPSHEKISQVRSRLQKERGDFARWMSRLKRAFHVVEKTQQRINRLERQLTQMEDRDGTHH